MGATTVPGVYAAGDVVTGAKTVVHAVAGAKIAPNAMIEWLELQEREANFSHDSATCFSQKARGLYPFG